MTPCTKCNGTRTAPRQPPYNNAILYPTLAGTEGSCEHCSGSGYEPARSAHEQMRVAAKNASGN